MGLSEKIRREYEKMKQEPDYEKAARFISLRQRRKRAEQVINLHVVGSFAVGFALSHFLTGRYSLLTKPHYLQGLCTSMM